MEEIAKPKKGTKVVVPVEENEIIVNSDNTEEIDTELLEDVEHGENSELEETPDEEKKEEDNLVSTDENEADSPKEEVSDIQVSILATREAFEDMLQKKMEAQYCEADIIKDILEIMNSKRARAIKNFNISKNKFEDIRNEVPKEVFDEAVKIDTGKYYIPVSNPEFAKSSLGKQIFKTLRTYLRSFEVEDTGFSARIEE